MESHKLISTEKATVVIQVNPQVSQNTVISDDGQEAGGSYHNTALQEYFKAQPKALGTVQIMNGLLILFYGIVRTTINYYRIGSDLSLFSGVTYWGSLVYISAGSLSVAAQNKLNLCVVKTSLIMNVLSVGTAAAAIILMSIDFGSEINYCYDSRCSPLEISNLGGHGVLLVFSILQIIVSICISGFACIATYNSRSSVVNVALNQV